MSNNQEGRKKNNNKNLICKQFFERCFNNTHSPVNEFLQIPLENIEILKYLCNNFKIKNDNQRKKFDKTYPVETDG